MVFPKTLPALLMLTRLPPHQQFRQPVLGPGKIVISSSGGEMAPQNSNLIPGAESWFILSVRHHIKNQHTA